MEKKKKLAQELDANDDWLSEEFITMAQQRGVVIIKVRKLSGALSTASFTCDHIRDWVLGTPEKTWVSIGVFFNDFTIVQLMSSQGKSWMPQLKS